VRIRIDLSSVNDRQNTYALIIVGSRASGFSHGKDGEAGDIGCIVDVRLRRRCSQAEDKPLEARSSFQTKPTFRRIVDKRAEVN